MNSKARFISERDLGENDRQAVRRLLDEFRYRGWKDSGGAALRIVKAVGRAEGKATAKKLASSAPTEFLVQNDLRRADLERALCEFTSGSRPRT